MLKGIDYLKNQRHLTEDVINLFQLMYCDESGTVYADTSFPESALPKDTRFYDSVLFPIYDLYNNVIAISGRSLSPNAVAKYINTVYPKANHLFGLNRTWKECLKEKKVYVVEGNVDMIMMWQSGIKNVVGMLGSNLTLTQICLLARFVERIVLVPDGDNAGIKFLEKIKKSIPKKYEDFNISFGIVNLPSGYDPDKFLLEKGSKSLLQLESDMFLSLKQKLQNRLGVANG
jgi:DNA primase